MLLFRTSQTQDEAVSVQSMSQESMVEKTPKNTTNSRIEYDEDNDAPVHYLDPSETDDMKNMKLKRLFKSRAKKLIERAESLNRDQLDDMMDAYALNNSEEEKERKILDPKIKDVKKLASPSGSVENFDISLDLENDSVLDKNLLANKNDKKVTIQEKNGKAEEDKKGDLTDEEFKKIRHQKNKY